MKIKNKRKQGIRKGRMKFEECYGRLGRNEENMKKYKGK